MRCPYCDGDKLATVDSRHDQLGHVKRKRGCLICGRKFATIESISAEGLLVKKRDGNVEPFSRAKLAKGINRAAAGAYALPPEAVNAFVDRVVHVLQPEAPGMPIPSKEIGCHVLEQLHDSNAITDVARIRYAIVFLGSTTKPGGFRHLQSFLEWLEDAYGPPGNTRPISTPYTVLKRDGRAEQFDLKKLERSIGIAAKGRGPDQHVRDRATSIARTATEELRGQALVTSQQIAAEVLKILHKRDAMAYLRYASAVKRYRSVQDFWMDASGFDSEDR